MCITLLLWNIKNIACDLTFHVFPLPDFAFVATLHPNPIYNLDFLERFLMNQSDSEGWM